MSIYISNISYEVEEDDLKRIFEEYGTVKKVQVPTSKKTGKNKGFAVVEMETSAEEISAIQMLRGAKWMGRILKVNRARTELEEVYSCHL
ncbi:RNA recognition motif domain-containing protein [Chlorogloeopsis fritschii PCC 9212]|jgi:RNA recognition motif-containing protein|uniref:RNA-binding protein n=1 Tax=Chlorogloeopsis fritschii PCC 6912 TaxID=211165 RepID=A0A3S0XN79_CHLFR|nr:MULTISPECIES: RNA-binding protein [Chlorogloeopsis]MBF2009073.1 RNA-binding protein [Chlorogloeopsis fritschii C42_A2020_084]MDM9385516.1 RNA-binding protein [Chlorogloeopsis sp. ULAP01]RUR73248.1 RNA-binding protein [Chlorogloeopsis fritschii PCC 6912]